MGLFGKKKDNSGEGNAKPKKGKDRGQNDATVDSGGDKPAKKSFFGGGRKSKPADSADGSQAQQPSSAPSKSSEKARLNKIRKMKKMFDETVWPNILDVMRTSIPHFTLTAPDPENPGAEMARYVTFGFDTKAADNFANRSDEDTGSLMVAIKSSMDCIVEDRLFDNELILMVPTPKTLAALAEFDDIYKPDLKIVYVDDRHGFEIETVSDDSEEPLTVKLTQVRAMLDNNVYITDFIDSLRGASREAPASDYSDTIDGGISESGDAGGDSYSDSSPYNGYPDGDGDYGSDGGSYDGDDDDDEPYSQPAGDYQDDGGSGYGDSVPVEDVSEAASAAVAGARAHANAISGQYDDVTGAAGGSQDSEPGDSEQPAAKPSSKPAAGGRVPSVKAAQDAISRISQSVQAASDLAKQDEDIRRAQESAAQVIATSEEEFDAEALAKYVTRKYYSDDLELEVSSQPFDSAFIQSNDYVPFAEVESDNWLDSYANNLRRDANTRLSRLHKENLLLMRNRYMMIIADYCESIVKSVATDDPNTRFGYAMSIIEATKGKALEELSERAEAYKKECEDKYQARLQAEIENASNVARAAFINRYERDHQRELKEIEQDLRSVIESDYIADKNNLLTMRRNEARRQLDKGISETIKLCNDEYVKMIAFEKKEYVRLQKVIFEWINGNMAADNANTRVEAEKQRRENEVDVVRREYESKLGLMSADFNAGLAQARADIERRDAEHEAYVIELKDQYEARLQSMRNSHAETVAHKDNEIGVLTTQLSEANGNVDELVRKYANLEFETNDKYKNQIDMLASERNAWNEHAHHIEGMHRYTDRLKLAGTIIAIVAAAGAGIIIGAMLMSGSPAKLVAKIFSGGQQQDPVVHYYVDGQETSGDGGTVTLPDGSSVTVTEGANAPQDNQ